VLTFGDGVRIAARLAAGPVRSSSDVASRAL
jgi:hypothetical protein